MSAVAWLGRGPFGPPRLAAGFRVGPDAKVGYVREMENSMRKSRPRVVETGLARVAEGVRLYAIGDVHGRSDLLHQLFARIDADLASRRSPRPTEVYLGDYVDRGPGSRKVIDLLIARRCSRPLICLKGNHETFVSEFIKTPATLAEWQHFGGLETLLSYGLQPSMNAD